MATEYEQIHTSLNSRVYRWERRWDEVGKLRVKRWVRTDELATDDDHHHTAHDGTAPGSTDMEVMPSAGGQDREATPGLVRVDRQQKRVVDFNEMDDAEALQDTTMDDPTPQHVDRSSMDVTTRWQCSVVETSNETMSNNNAVRFAFYFVCVSTIMDSQPVVLLAHHDDATRLFAGTIDGRLLAFNIDDIIHTDQHLSSSMSAAPHEMVVDTMCKDATIVDPIDFRHNAACRALDNLSNNLLISGAQDGVVAIVDHTTNQLLSTYTNNNNDDNDVSAVPVSALSALTQNMFAVGDEDGIVKLYDTRSKNALIHQWHDHEDFVSGMLLMRHKLMTVGGDGYLCVFDPRMNGKLIARSDQQDEGFTSVVSIYSHTNKPRILCGTESGVLSVFNWGWWGDVKDRVVGHPENVGCLCVVDDASGQLITGSDDGIVRMLRVQPNQFLGIVAEVNDPVESMALLADGENVAFCSHDTKIRICRISDTVGEEAGEDMARHDDEKTADNSSDDSLDSDSDDSEEEDRFKRRKKVKEKSIKKLKSFAKEKAREKAAAFFGDLIDE